MALSSLPITHEPRQLSLRFLLGAMAVMAAFLAACRAFGIYGAVFAWWTCVAYSAVIAGTSGTGGTRLVGDFLWGAFLPLVCVAYDPGLFYFSLSLEIDRPAHWDRPEQLLTGYTLLIYGAIGLQIVALTLWLFLGSACGRAAGIFSGILGVGAFLAFGLGLLLTPLALLGVSYGGIGVLGLTPLFTGWAFAQRSGEARDVAETHLEGRAVVLCMFAGLMLATLGPAVVALAVCVVCG